MIELNLKVNGVKDKYEICNDWSEATVEQFMKFSAIDFKAKTEIETLVDVISAFSSISPDELLLIPAKKFMKIIDAMEFTKSKLPEVEKDSIIINDEEYFLKKDFKDLNTGEMISINMIIEQGDDNLNRVIDKLLCIFLRKKVDGEIEVFTNDMMSRCDMFKKVKITEVHEMFIFFSNIKITSEVNIKVSSRAEKRKKGDSK